MLDNLRLGSTSGSITRTSADSDIASNFTLPQLYSATNYGYLYNWPAVTAGESRTSHNQTAGNAPHSVCPKNWRLPTSGLTGDSTGEFILLNAKMNNPSATSTSTAGDSGVGDFADLDCGFGGTGNWQSSGPSTAKWQFTGPFRGVFSGGWWDGFMIQDSGGFFWSSSAHSDSSGCVIYASFYPGGDEASRGGGFGVRCLLK